MTDQERPFVEPEILAVNDDQQKDESHHVPPEMIGTDWVLADSETIVETNPGGKTYDNDPKAIDSPNSDNGSISDLDPQRSPESAA